MSGVGKFLDRSALTPTLLLVLVRLIKESLRSELITPFFDVIIQVSTLILPVYHDVGAQVDEDLLESESGDYTST